MVPGYLPFVFSHNLNEYGSKSRYLLSVCARLSSHLFLNQSTSLSAGWSYQRSLEQFWERKSLEFMASGTINISRYMSCFIQLVDRPIFDRHFLITSRRFRN